MALKMDITSATGLMVQGAYVKIDEYFSYKDDCIFAKVRGYVSRELESAGSAPIEGTEEIIELVCDYSDGAKNSKSQIYTYMKTLEKYANALDVLEE